MIINIRGTSGSGKTTVVRGLMAAAQTEQLFADDSRGNLFGPVHPEAYALHGISSRPTYLIGSYEQVCGGCDSISTQDGICDRVRKYAALGHVVFEGLLLSHLYGRYEALDRELGQPYVWAFLDTPLEVCLDRVRARRIARGVTKELNPTNTTQKWGDMRRVAAKAKHAELDVRWLDHNKAVEEVLSWLRKA